MPAAAVIREGQALFGMTGRKGFVDCNKSYKVIVSVLLLTGESWQPRLMKFSDLINC